MKVKCKDLDPYKCCQRHNIKYKMLYSASNNYLDNISESSDEMQVCYVGYNEVHKMAKDLEEI